MKDITCNVNLGGRRLFRVAAYRHVYLTQRKPKSRYQGTDLNDSVSRLSKDGFN